MWSVKNLLIKRTLNYNNRETVGISFTFNKQVNRLTNKHKTQDQIPIDVQLLDGFQVFLSILEIHEVLTIHSNLMVKIMCGKL